MAKKVPGTAELPTERFLDIVHEPLKLLSPIKNYEKQPLVSLEEAVKPIEHLFDNMQTDVWVAKNNCNKPKDGLSINESAAIYLYSMESIYSELNAALRDKDRKRLIPFFSYLKLFLTALWKLESVKCVVWRGVKADITIGVLEKEQFLGKTGRRTLFMIECLNGKVIQNHSHYESEHEVLLLPCSHFEVVSKLDQGYGLHTIHVRQIQPPVSLIQPPFDVAAAFVHPDVTHHTTSSPKAVAVAQQNNYMLQCPQCSKNFSNNDENNYMKHVTQCLNDESIQPPYTASKIASAIPLNLDESSIRTKTSALNFESLKEKPRICLKVHSEAGRAMVGNDQYLLYCDSRRLRVFDRQVSEKFTVEAPFMVLDVCWSLRLNQFLLLSTDRKMLCALNSTGMLQEPTKVKEFSTEISSCACYNDQFIITTTGKGSLIEVYNITTWKLIQTYKPPHSCKQNQNIFKIRFNSTGSHVGLILGKGKHPEWKYWFELRNSNIISVLQMTELGTNIDCCALLSLPHQQFLGVSQYRNSLFIIDSDGKHKEIQIASKTVQSLGLINEKWLVLETHETWGSVTELHLYDL
ncbi:unnamed protein product [Didymodactylos carnosus]|uniref:NAD(P)(+)--arginine ADP-ribosyltransferase n=1 Tax=Didymodactylos carnosus TaxID=1234261 RepID=A0A815E819_9BILA|nr:unnamed protein product [Didymodactylos carnosus]CAF4143105.1 unnamed protein product [Didymodactylos carnosus]